VVLGELAKVEWWIGIHIVIGCNTKRTTYKRNSYAKAGFSQSVAATIGQCLQLLLVELVLLHGDHNTILAVTNRVHKTHSM
jgi:hypothetical protein